MTLRKCPKCKELINPESIACPRCGVFFREYRIKRMACVVLVIAFVGYIFHDRIAQWIPIPGHPQHVQK